jgi:hypothetical protein
MSYQSCIEAAGAQVLAIKSFGDYQGTTWAKVAYGGSIGWISWAFGSCSYCDDYESWAESVPHEDDDIPESMMAEFGRRYLDDVMGQRRAEVEVGKDSDWDSEAETVLAFIRENAA